MRYASNDRMSLPMLTATAAQHVLSLCVFLVFPILVGQAAGVPRQDLMGLLSVSLVALGIANLLQALPRLGSGYLCPAGMTAAYLGPSLVAARLGGLPLVFGMTIFAGMVEVVLSQFLTRLKALMPPTILGIVILMVGIANGMTGFRTLFVSDGTLNDLLVCGVALLVMVVSSLGAGGRVQVFCALLGILAGSAAAAVTQTEEFRNLPHFGDLPFFAMPPLPKAPPLFSLALALPFIVVAFTAAIKQVGFVVTAAEAEGGADGIRVGTATGRGVLADGLGTIAGGLLGGLGVNVSASSQGIIAATGVAARRVSYAIATMLIVLGFQPHFVMLLSVMPKGVIAAVLIFTSIFVVSSGMQTIVAAGLGREQVICVGLAVLSGLATDAVPRIASMAPNGLKPFAGSAFVAGTTIAILVNGTITLSHIASRVWRSPRPWRRDTSAQPAVDN